MKSVLRCPWTPLLIVLAAAVGLRLVVMAAYWPASLQHPGAGDAASYVQSARLGLWGDPIRTPGYPAFLRLAHSVSDQLAFTVVVQHLLGIAAGLLLYAAIRRLGGSRPAALAGAAVVLLNGDALFLEHTLLSDGPFVFALASSLYLAARAVDESLWIWLAPLGLAVGSAILVRSVALILVPVLVVWLLLAAEGRWRRRAVGAAAFLGVVCAVLAGDAALRAHNTPYEAWGPTNGWALYARVGQFADCGTFEPPRGTEQLCESTLPGERPGPTYYASQPEAPAKRFFGVPPNGNEELGAFARAAIRAQPLDYAETVLTDLARYVKPDLEERVFGGLGPEALRIDQAAVPPTVDPYYQDVDFKQRAGARALALYQRVVRVHGAFYVLGFVLGVAGLVLARGRPQAGIALLGGVSFLLLVFPSAIHSYDPRYGIPPTGPLAAAAAMGAAVVVDRARERRAERRGSDAA